MLRADVEKALEPLLERLKDVRIMNSQGSDDVELIAADGEFTLSAVLRQLGHLRSVGNAAYTEALKNYLSAFEEDEAKEALGGWNNVWKSITTNGEGDILELRNFNDLQRNEWDDSLYVIAVKDKDSGTWWAIGARFEDPDEGPVYPDPLEAEGPPDEKPEWMEALLDHRLLMMYGQEKTAAGAGHSSGSSPGDGPLLAMQGDTADGAIDSYLHASRFLSIHPFAGFLQFGKQGCPEDIVQSLENVLTSGLGQTKLYVLGNYSVFNLFVAGACQDGCTVGVTTSWS